MTNLEYKESNFSCTQDREIRCFTLGEKFLYHPLISRPRTLITEGLDSAVGGVSRLIFRVCRFDSRIRHLSRSVSGERLHTPKWVKPA